MEERRKARKALARAAVSDDLATCERIIAQERARLSVLFAQYLPRDIASCAVSDEVARLWRRAIRVAARANLCRLCISILGKASTRDANINDLYMAMIDGALCGHHGKLALDAEKSAKSEGIVIEPSVTSTITYGTVHQIKFACARGTLEEVVNAYKCCDGLRDKIVARIISRGDRRIVRAIRDMELSRLRQLTPDIVAEQIAKYGRRESTAIERERWHECMHSHRGFVKGLVFDGDVEFGRLIDRAAQLGNFAVIFDNIRQTYGGARLRTRAIIHALGAQQYYLAICLIEQRPRIHRYETPPCMPRLTCEELVRMREYAHTYKIDSSIITLWLRNAMLNLARAICVPESPACLIDTEIMSTIARLACTTS